MEDVNSCIVCKALCGESEFEDVTGSLLETIVKVKVLAELPFMLEPGTLSNRTDLKICRVCKGILEKIQDNIKHLKDRVARRRVNFARMQFRQSRSVNCDADQGAHLSADLNCDSDGSSRDKLGLGLRQSSNESKESNSPCTVLSHTSCASDTEQLDQCREVRIRVPPSINATFIVLESSHNSMNDCVAKNGGENLLKSITDSQDTKITDIIASGSYEKPHHVNINAFVEQNSKPQTTAIQNEIKRQAPIINVTSCDDNSSDSIRSSHNGHASLQHAGGGSVDIPVQHSNDMKRKRSLTTQSRSFDEDSRAKLARLEQLKAESNASSRSLTASPNPNHAERHVLLAKKLSPDVKALDLSLRTPGQTYTLYPNAVSLASLSPALLRSMPLQHNNKLMSNSVDSLHTHSFERGPSMERQSTEDSVASYNSEDPDRDSLHVSGDQEGKYPCEICGKSFEKKCFWKRHVVWYHNDQAYTCVHCGGKFAERYSLQIHESHEHGINSAIPVNVPDQMLNQTQLRDNNLQKSRKKIQYCAQCHEHFTSKYDLLRHRVTTGHMGGAEGVCIDREEEELVSHSQKAKSMSRLSPSSLTTPKLQHSWSSSPYDSLMSRNTLTAPLIKTKGVSLDTGLSQTPLDETPVGGAVSSASVDDSSCGDKDLLGFRSVTMVKAASMDSGLNRGGSPASETTEQYVYSKEGNHLRVLEGPNVK